jgi:hypothetical protein
VEVTPFFESAKRLERLEQSVAVERLKRAAVVSERLNDLNVWNRPRLLNGWRAASLVLTIARCLFLHDPSYAILCCQIKKLPWSDPGTSRDQTHIGNQDLA